MAQSPPRNNPQRSLNLFFFNCGSVTAKRGELEALFWEHKIDVAFLQESFLNPDLPFKMTNYVIYRNDKGRCQGGGTATQYPTLPNPATPTGIPQGYHSRGHVPL